MTGHHLIGLSGELDPVFGYAKLKGFVHRSAGSGRHLSGLFGLLAELVGVAHILTYRSGPVCPEAPKGEKRPADVLGNAVHVSLPQ